MTLLKLLADGNTDEGPSLFSLLLRDGAQDIVAGGAEGRARGAARRLNRERTRDSKDARYRRRLGPSAAAGCGAARRRARSRLERHGAGAAVQAPGDVEGGTARSRPFDDPLLLRRGFHLRGQVDRLTGL